MIDLYPCTWALSWKQNWNFSKKEFQAQNIVDAKALLSFGGVITRRFKIPSSSYQKFQPSQDTACISDFCFTLKKLKSIHQYASIYISIYASIYISIYASIYISIYASIYISIYASIYISIYASIYNSIYASIYISIYASIYISIYASVWISIHQYLCISMNQYTSAYISMHRNICSVYVRQCTSEYISIHLPGKHLLTNMQYFLIDLQSPPK
jgi:hypothetical protein